MHIHVGNKPAEDPSETTVKGRIIHDKTYERLKSDNPVSIPRILAVLDKCVTMAIEYSCYDATLLLNCMSISPQEIDVE
jgi:hypothetical protein